MSLTKRQQLTLGPWVSVSYPLGQDKPFRTDGIKCFCVKSRPLWGGYREANQE